MGVGYQAYWVQGFSEAERLWEEFHIATQPELVAADPATILLDIPYGPQLEAVRTRFVDYGPEWKSWFGTLRPAGSRGLPAAAA